MQILWRLGDAVVNDIIARTDEPHPKYTTVATFLKILENKGFVNHTAEGKSHRYFPLIGREEYARGVMSSMLSSYFDPATKLIYAAGAIVGLIGAIKVYSKFSSGDPDTGKTAGSWFGACVFLIVAATVLRSFFL